VRTTLDAGAILSAICRQCGRVADVNLAALERRGMGEVPLLALRLRCSGCNSTDCDVVIGGSYLAPF
jgi:hypothetical protein